MRGDTLGEQLRRVGGLTAVAVIAATALGAFAALKRVFPASASPAAVVLPSTIKPAPPRVIATPSGAAASAAGSSDPSERQIELSVQQRAEARALRRQAAINLRLNARAGKTITVHLPNDTVTVIHTRTIQSADTPRTGDATPTPTNTGTTTRGTSQSPTTAGGAKHTTSKTQPTGAKSGGTQKNTGSTHPTGSGGTGI
jgi:hypothetical protein